MKVSVILPAAGLGTRMGRSSPRSRHQPQAVHAAGRRADSPPHHSQVLSLPVGDRSRRRAAGRGDGLGQANCSPANARQAGALVEGGDTRQQSVENALAALGPDIDLVAVHDAVRPFIDPATIERVIQEAAGHGAAIVGIVPVDTVKQVKRNKIRGTLSRDRLVLAQTPQVFRVDLLRRAFAKAREDGFIGTDESSLVERLEQVEVSVVPGSDRNIKITKPSDMELARLFLAEETGRKKTP